MIVSGSGDMAEVFLESHLKTYSGLEGRDPGRWSLARGEASLTFQEKDRQSDRGLIVDLFAAIPVPDKAVPLTDILEFKEKRRAELVALRHHLDEIYQSIVNSADKPHAKAAALQAMDSALVDLLKVSQESGLKMKLSGLEAKIDVLDLKSGVMAAVGALGYGLPLTAAAIAGIAGALVPSFTIKNGFSIKREKRSATPFEYVSRYHRDLF